MPIVYLLPAVVKSYAPEGRTPVLRAKQTRDHLSVMGVMTPLGKISTLARQETLNGLHSDSFIHRRVLDPEQRTRSAAGGPSGEQRAGGAA